MKIPLFILLLLTVFKSTAQTIDTIWYNRKWAETSVVSEHYYYRTIQQNPETKEYAVKDHYANGKIQMSGTYSSMTPEIKNGEFIYYNENGIMTDKRIYLNNFEGETTQYDNQGKQTFHIIKAEYLAKLTPQQKKEKYGIVDIDKQPEYADGVNALYDFINKNMVYPKEAIEKKIQGHVIVSLSLDENGKVLKVILVHGLDPSLDKEALRVAGLLPDKWIPALDKGKNVASNFTFPIAFKIKN